MLRLQMEEMQLYPPTRSPSPTHIMHAHMGTCIIAHIHTYIKVEEHVTGFLRKHTNK
jgi:hypothetical protein